MSLVGLCLRPLRMDRCQHCLQVLENCCDQRNHAMDNSMGYRVDASRVHRRDTETLEQLDHRGYQQHG